MVLGRQCLAVFNVLVIHIDRAIHLGTVSAIYEVSIFAAFEVQGPVETIFFVLRRIILKRGNPFFELGPSNRKHSQTPL